ncbi:MAG TPA: hypothetical protein VM935_04940, partial [Chitinophagaceae bacterium]|nr:hypothetical protein [Chitinophagaceae bacterium]
MKKYLLSFLLFTTVSLFTKIYAQCSITDLQVDLTSSATVGGTCNVTFNITFLLDNNNGNKNIGIHLWRAGNYSLFTHNYTKPPTLADLGGAANKPVATILLDNVTTATPISLNSYGPDPSNITTIQTNAIGSIVKTASGNPAFPNRITLTGVQMSIPGACAGLVLQGDAWGTNGNFNANLHCRTLGISFFGDPTITGLVNCSTPRTFQVVINTVSIPSITATYKVYIDNGVLGTYEAGTDVLAYTSGTINFSAASPYNSGPLAYTGNNTNPSASRPLIVVLSTSSPFSKINYGTLENSCIPLPVTFKSFNVTRKNVSAVGVTWTTASEKDNRGFNVQRNDGTGWKNVAFVF